MDNDVIIHLVYQYGDQLYRYAYHMTRNKQDAQDIVQDTFVKVLDIKNIESITNISAYLYKITYNCTVDFIKNKHKGTITKLFFCDISKSAEEEYLDDSVSGIIQEALDQLNYEDRTVFLLRALEDMEYSTISAIMDIKEATLRKKYERSRKKIKKYLEKKEEREYEYKFGGIIGKNNSK